MHIPAGLGLVQQQRASVLFPQVPGEGVQRETVPA